MKHPKQQLGFFYDQRWCIGCRACQVACKDMYDLPAGVNWRRVATLEYGKYPRPEAFHLSMACNHCCRPACVDACPVGAITKRSDNGVVELDGSLCTGCRACVEACPYGAPQYDEAAERVGKCNLCADLITRGEVPVCVSACVMQVLRVDWLEDVSISMLPYGRGLPDPSTTVPSLRIVGHRHAEADGELAGAHEEVN